MSGAALADEVVHVGPYGQSGAVSFVKPTSNATSIALYQNGRGVGKAAHSQKENVKPAWQTAGPFGNGGAVSFYSEAR